MLSRKRESKARHYERKGDQRETEKIKYRDKSEKTHKIRER